MNEADNQAETAVSVNYEIPDKSEPGQSDPGTEYPSVGGKQLELFQEKLLAPESRSRHKLIGQLFDTYWLVEFENQFYIIDPEFGVRGTDVGSAMAGGETEDNVGGSSVGRGPADLLDGDDLPLAIGGILCRFTFYQVLSLIHI